MVAEHHHPFEAGKFHHLNLLEHLRTNYGKMAEANRNPEVFLLDHVKDQLVDVVKVVTELLNEGLNFEFLGSRKSAPRSEPMFSTTGNVC